MLSTKVLVNFKIFNIGLKKKHFFHVSPKNSFVEPNLIQKPTKTQNKAKAISAKLLVVNLKNYLDGKRGKIWRNWKKQEETEKLKKKQDQRSKPWSTFCLLCWFLTHLISFYFGENMCLYENIFFRKPFFFWKHVFRWNHVFFLWKYVFLGENICFGKNTYFWENIILVKTWFLVKT